MNVNVKDELIAIGKEAVSSVNFSQEDREKVTEWVAGLASATVRAQLISDPDELKALADEAQGFKDALELKAAQYEVKAASAAERALTKVLNRVAALAFAMI